MQERENQSERCCWIVAADRSIGEELATGVNAAGLRATLLTQGDVSGEDIITLEDGSRDALHSAFEAALGVSGLPALVLFALTPATSLDSSPIDALSPDAWRAEAEEPARTFLHGIQALLDLLGGKPVAVVALGPTLGHVGARGLIALSTALEAQRGIVKSAARQLGQGGVTVNWVGVAPEAYSAALDTDAIPHGPEVGRENYALGHPANLRNEVAAAISLFANPLARPITGATLNIDGGEWMLP